MSTQRENLLTPDEYLARERVADFKCDYIDGVLYAMGGASERHNLIAANLLAVVNTHLLDKPCRAYGSDMKIHRADSRRCFYPDLSAVCGEPRFLDAERDVLINPTLIIEVLSESTEAYDRGVKLTSYTRLESLQEYVLVAQDNFVAERYLRQEGGWLYSRIEGLDEELVLASLDLRTPMRRVYAKATEPSVPPEPEQPGPQESGT